MTDLRAQLQAKHDLYLRLLPTQQDADGFIYTDTCDSLLFSCLVGCVPGVHVNVTAAMDYSGQWFRRPLRRYEECLGCGGASATISRDMLLGLMWFCWRNKRLDLIEQLVHYALEHFCVMGRAATWSDWFGKCLLMPGLLATAAEIVFRLGGYNHWFLRSLPQYESPSVVDYQAHLSVLHQLLRRELTGSEVKYDHAQRQPHNPLFLYAAGWTDEAAACLLEDPAWPADRLPTSADTADSWPMQRDVGPSWEPAGGGFPSTEPVPPKQWVGGDFLFVSHLILGGKQ